MSVKIERIENNLVKEISYILATEIKDNDIKFVTITGVKVTNDYSFAKVYFTVLDDNKKQTTIQSLKNAADYVRRELADRVIMRQIPKLIFVYDESIEYGQKIEDILEKLNEEK